MHVLAYILCTSFHITHCYIDLQKNPHPKIIFNDGIIFIDPTFHTKPDQILPKNPYLKSETYQYNLNLHNPSEPYDYSQQYENAQKELEKERLARIDKHSVNHQKDSTKNILAQNPYVGALLLAISGITIAYDYCYKRYNKAKDKNEDDLYNMLKYDESLSEKEMFACFDLYSIDAFIKALKKTPDYEKNMIALYQDFQKKNWAYRLYYNKVYNKVTQLYFEIQDKRQKEREKHERKQKEYLSKLEKAIDFPHFKDYYPTRRLQAIHETNQTMNERSTYYGEVTQEALAFAHNQLKIENRYLLSGYMNPYEKQMQNEFNEQIEYLSNFHLIYNVNVQQNIFFDSAAYGITAGVQSNHSSDPIATTRLSNFVWDTITFMKGGAEWAAYGAYSAFEGTVQTIAHPITTFRGICSLASFVARLVGFNAMRTFPPTNEKAKKFNEWIQKGREETMKPLLALKDFCVDKLQDASITDVGKPIGYAAGAYLGSIAVGYVAGNIMAGVIYFAMQCWARIILYQLPRYYVDFCTVCRPLLSTTTNTKVITKGSDLLEKASKIVGFQECACGSLMKLVEKGSSCTAQVKDVINIASVNAAVKMLRNSKVAKTAQEVSKTSEKVSKGVSTIEMVAEPLKKSTTAAKTIEASQPVAKAIATTKNIGKMIAASKVIEKTAEVASASIAPALSTAQHLTSIPPEELSKAQAIQLYKESNKGRIIFPNQVLAALPESWPVQLKQEVAQALSAFDGLKGFEEFAHKNIKVNLMHILAPQSKFNKKGEFDSISGFHHDCNGDIKKHTDIRFEIIGEKTKDGFYTANASLNGNPLKQKATFFPDEWSRQEVAESIRDAYLDAKENLLNLNSFKPGVDEKYKLIGFTKDKKHKIEMIITKAGEMVTAYPVINA